MSGRRFGPGLLVTAAFVGPGTIATASSAGAGFGYTLLWALVFSVGATIVLQEMAVRQALVTRAGLATTLRQALDGTWDEYRKATRSYGARRDDIRDAADFMGWYMRGSTEQLGIRLDDARRVHQHRDAVVRDRQGGLAGA